MHAATRMPRRMEEAIDCMKWFQYNHQAFQNKKTVSMVGEGQAYDFVDPHAWSTSLQRTPTSSQNVDNRGRTRERYVPYKGQVSPSTSTLDEQKVTPSKPDKGLEDRMTSLEDMFRQVSPAWWPCRGPLDLQCRGKGWGELGLPSRRAWHPGLGCGDPHWWSGVVWACGAQRGLDFGGTRAECGCTGRVWRAREVVG